MFRFKTATSALLALIVVGLAATSFAKAAPQRCGFNGDYSFFFWDPSFPVSGVGYFSVQLDPGDQVPFRSGPARRHHQL